MDQKTKKFYLEDNLPSILIVITSLITAYTKANTSFNFATTTVWNLGLFVFLIIISTLFILISKVHPKFRLNFSFERFFIIYLFGICLFFFSSIISLFTPFQNTLTSIAIYLAFNISINYFSKKESAVAWCEWFFPRSLFLYFGGIIAANIFINLNILILAQLSFAIVVILMIITTSVILLNKVNAKLLEMSKTKHTFENLIK